MRAKPDVPATHDPGASTLDANDSGTCDPDASKPDHIDPISSNSFCESDIEVWLGERESVVQAVETNADLLKKLLDQVGDLQNAARNSSPSLVAKKNDATEIALRARIEELEAQLQESQEQNNELATQVARANVEEALSTSESGATDALSWEERKELIFQQMEDDSFDADEFIASLSQETNSATADQPAHTDDQDHQSQSIDTASKETAEAMETLLAELERRDAMLCSRDEEIENLRHLLSQQPDTQQEGVAVGAAAIAAMVDSDELVQQERERLQLLQAEWQEKFRATEIETSLERAKLSRDRRELGQRQEELEIEIAQLRRQLQSQNEQGSGSRKWRSKLGLSD